MSWWIWVLLAFFLLSVEFFATTMHVGFFAVGALLVGLLAALGVAGPLWAQLLTFSISSVVALIFVRPFIVRKLGMNRAPVVDSIVGEQAVALSEIPVSGVGKAELRGSTWNARNVSDVALITGQRCVVEQVEGLTLYLRP
jgi:membrane protein implicated in regulation of membrane protease activity